MDLIAQYTEDLQSKEGQDLLNKLSKFSNKIEEALDFDNFISDMRSLSEADFYKSSILRRETRRLNEQEVAAIANQEIESEIESTINDAGVLPKGEEGILGMLKSLWNGLTEGGTPIGILHLVLDFIGIVGDAFTFIGLPLGMVADFINAMIYFYREKYILGIISLIAMIPFGGDVAKGFKAVAGLFSKPFSKIFNKGAGKEIAQNSAAVLGKQSGETFAKSKRFLNYIKKSAAQIAANITSAISFLLEKVVAKAVGWVPFIGKPLKKFLTNIADYGKIVANNLLDFAKHIDAPIAAQITKKASRNFKLMEDTLRSGGKVTKKGTDIVIKDSSKKVLKKIPIDDIATFSNISKKFPDGPMKSVLKTPNSVADYYVFISKTGSSAGAFLNKNAGVILYKKLTLRGLKFFIAKQIIKLLGDSGKALSDYELEGITNVITTKELNDRMSEHAKNERERKGSLIDVPYIDQQLKDNPDTEIREDQLVYDLQKHLNYNAQLMGLPNFPEYVYAKAKEEKENELAEFYSTRQISDEKFNKIMGIKGEGAKAFESFKYIKPFYTW
jgi:hypothetical protein